MLAHRPTAACSDASSSTRSSGSSVSGGDTSGTGCVERVWGSGGASGIGDDSVASGCACGDGICDNSPARGCVCDNDICGSIGGCEGAEMAASEDGVTSKPEDAADSKQRHPESPSPPIPHSSSTTSPSSLPIPTMTSRTISFSNIVLSSEPNLLPSPPFSLSHAAPVSFVRSPTTPIFAGLSPGALEATLRKHSTTAHRAGAQTRTLGSMRSEPRRGVNV